MVVKGKGPSLFGRNWLEHDRLVKYGILTPVEVADWAAPIVPILKSDKKSVRICGNFLPGFQSG